MPPRARRPHKNLALTRELPAASAQAAARRADKAHEKLVAAARAAVSRVKAAEGKIEERFYEVGEALAQLQRTEALHALGFRSFVELCRKELEIDTDLALRLVHVATKMTAEAAKRLGGRDALALASLADSGPDADTVALSGDILAAHGALLASTKRNSAPPPGLRNGAAGRAAPAEAAKAKKAEPAKVAKTRAAAKKGKAAPAKKASAPKAVSDKELAARLQKQLRDAGLSRAKIVLVPNKGREADLRIEGVNVSVLSVLGQELTRFAKG